MKNNKGFTLIELVGIIIIFSIISILAFTSFTKTLKEHKADELNEYKEKLITATTLYIEMHLDDFEELNAVGGTITITAKQLSDEGYVKETIKTPSECSINDTTIVVTKNEDKTISYEVKCN